DDGVSTAINNRTLRDNNFDLSKLLKSSGGNYLISKLSYRLWGIIEKKKKFTHWFTCFNINAIGNEQVVMHRFEYLKTMMHSRKVTKLENSIFFIGSNLSGVGVMDLLDELKLLGLIAERYLKAGIEVI